MFLKRILSILLLSFPVALSAQQYMSWACSVGEANNEYPSNIVIDAAGNTYETGVFTNTIDADPGPGVYNLVSNGANDIYVIKYDPAGGLLWAFSIGGTGSDGASIALDATGNPVIAGNVYGTVDFDPGGGVFNLSTVGGSSDIFVAKYTAAGALSWAVITGGTSDEGASDVTLDASGNILITGSFSGFNTDFNPGAGVFLMSPGGLYDEYVLKLNSSGAFSWAKQCLGSATSWSTAYSIYTDISGNVFTTGSFNSTVDFNTGAGVLNFTAQGYMDGFLKKLDASGNFVWAKQIVSSSNIDFGRSVVADAGGNVFVTGLFEGLVDFDPGPGTVNISPNGPNDVFVTKYNSAGNLTWVKILSGPAYAACYDIDIDPSGSYVTVAGDFLGDCDFDPGAGDYTLNSGTFNSGYICRLTSGGGFIWAGAFTGASNTYCNSVTTDACNNLSISGGFGTTLDAEPGSNSNMLTSAGNTDVFNLKLSQSYWTGNVSTDWHDPLNWECSTVPGIQSNVVIPTVVPRYPLLSLNTAVKSVFVQPAASIHVEPGVQMMINGHGN